MVGFIDSGEFGSSGAPLSGVPLSGAPLLRHLLLSHEKPVAYGWAQSAALNKDKDKDIDENRWKAEFQRVCNTARWLGMGVAEAENLIGMPYKKLIICMEEGRTRFELLKTALAHGKDVLTLPPLSGAEALLSAQTSGSRIVCWLPLRFASGVVTAKAALKNSRVISHISDYGATGYTKFWAHGAYPFLDLIRYLVGEIGEETLNIQSSGSLRTPSLSVSARHVSGAIGAWGITGQRFLQMYPHAYFRLTTEDRRLLIIDDTGLRRCAIFSAEESSVPHFSQDNSPMDASLAFMNHWLKSKDEDDGLPNIADSLKTVSLLEKHRSEFQIDSQKKQQ